MKILAAAGHRCKHGISKTVRHKHNLKEYRYEHQKRTKRDPSPRRQDLFEAPGARDSVPSKKDEASLCLFLGFVFNESLLIKIPTFIKLVTGIPC